MLDIFYKRFCLETCLSKWIGSYKCPFIITRVDNFVFEQRSIPSSLFNGYLASQLAQSHQSHLVLVWCYSAFFKNLNNLYIYIYVCVCCILFSVPLCAAICGICGYIWLRLLSQPDITVTTYYEFGVWSIIISCIIELCCEQLYIVAQAFLFVKLQVIKKMCKNNCVYYVVK